MGRDSVTICWLQSACWGVCNLSVHDRLGENSSNVEVFWLNSPTQQTITKTVVESCSHMWYDGALAKKNGSDLILVPPCPSRCPGSNGATLSSGTDSLKTQSMDSRNSKKILKSFTTLSKTDPIFVTKPSTFQEGCWFSLFKICHTNRADTLSFCFYLLRIMLHY